MATAPTADTMSNLSKKDFAKLCHMNTRKLAIYIGRSKVIVDDNGFINTKNEVNALFIAKNNTEAQEERAPEPTQRNQEEKTEALIPTTQREPEKLSLIAIDRKRKLADLEKTQIETRISLLKEEKLKGANIPVTIARDIVAALSKSFIIEFQNETASIIRILAKTKSYSNAEIAEIRGQMSKIINNAMSKGVESTKREISKIAANYAETREVGEHD